MLNAVPRHALFRKRKMFATQQVTWCRLPPKKRGGQVCRAKHVAQGQAGGVVQDMPPVDQTKGHCDSHAIWRLHPASSLRGSMMLTGCRATMM